MSEWKKVKLGDYIDVLSGFAYKSKDFSDSGIPVIKIKNVCPPYISLEDLSYVPNSIAFQNPRYILKKGDVLIAMTGSHINQIASVVGRVGRVRYDDITVLNQRVGKIVNKNNAKSSLDYIYYYLSQYEVKVELAQKAGGAANQANISPSDIKNLFFPCPPIETQHHIATILSRYDSLIENYQKQIKLLEEAAQRLYKEWFVDLHFPGHENTKIVDGVPEGWEKNVMEEIAEINKRNIPKNYEYSFVNYTDLGNVRLGRMDNPIRYNYGEEPGRAKRVAIDGDIIWGMVRPNLKSYALVQYPKEQDVFSTGFAVLTAKRVPFSFLYCYVTTEAFVGYLVNCTNGAAYPAVKPEHFSRAELILPSNNIMDMFNDMVEPMFRRIGKYQSQIRLLTEARDRLLPKLMSGEIAV